MTMIDTAATRSTEERWLTAYYLTRAAVSLVWVATALTLGQSNPAFGSILLLLYPLWDAAANYADLARNGGLTRSPIQAVNVFVSLATALAVLAALQHSLAAVLAVFGAWAILTGLLQLSTAVRRWSAAGAQWAMILSGGQSALAGAFFIMQAQRDVPAVLPIIAGYAAFGAIYFLVSAISLIIGNRMRRQR